LGIHNIIVSTQKPPPEENVQGATTGSALEYGLTFHDARQIAATLPVISQVLLVHDVEQWIWFKSRRIQAQVRGVTPEYLERLNLRPWLGRSLTSQDGATRERVCVVRNHLLQEARYLGDPLKLDLKLGHEYYHVVGVLPDNEFQSPNNLVLGIDDRSLEVYIPYETVLSRIGLESAASAGSTDTSRVELNSILCVVADDQDVMSAARGIQAVLENLHPRKDYMITVPLEMLASRQKTQRVFDIVLPIVAGVSLLVGGIGILNIMLASITERTREIGIRRALGATGADITAQFLVETVTLSGIGGLLGIGLGAAGVSLLRTLTEWDAVITPGAVALSLGVSCLTGIVFGLYPARKAAQMEPIRALRHE
ncbi:MAG TPA: FtsX-like permease family protein, partial [Planctomycetota bacterium]|nr:FtsX-like permease family protein [Planctomycetota bacterium]